MKTDHKWSFQLEVRWNGGLNGKDMVKNKSAHQGVFISRKKNMHTGEKRIFISGEKEYLYRGKKNIYIGKKGIFVSGKKEYLYRGKKNVHIGKKEDVYWGISGKRKLKLF